MADITMCLGIGCSVKNRCYRFVAIPDVVCQSYIVDPPIHNGKCEMYQTFVYDYSRSMRHTWRMFKVIQRTVTEWEKEFKSGYGGG